MTFCSLAGLSSSVRPDPNPCLCRGSRLSCAVLVPLEKAIQLPSGGALDEVPNKPGQFRKVCGAKMSNDRHTAGRQTSAISHSLTFFFLHQNKELQKVYLYFPLFCSFGFFRTFQCFVGLVYVYVVVLWGLILQVLQYLWLLLGESDPELLRDGSLLYCSEHQ